MVPARRDPCGLAAGAAYGGDGLFATPTLALSGLRRLVSCTGPSPPHQDSWGQKAGLLIARTNIGRERQTLINVALAKRAGGFGHRYGIDTLFTLNTCSLVGLDAADAAQPNNDFRGARIFDAKCNGSQLPNTTSTGTEMTVTEITRPRLFRASLAQPILKTPIFFCDPAWAAAGILAHPQCKTAKHSQRPCLPGRARSCPEKPPSDQRFQLSARVAPAWALGARRPPHGFVRSKRPPTAPKPCANSSSPKRGRSGFNPLQSPSDQDP